jgi:vitamin K-dependent gamma-carboxylase
VVASEGTATRFDLRAFLFRPIDIAGLVIFRVAFGAMMAFDTARYVAYGWVHDHYLEPGFTFKFYGFGWVGVLPAPLMYAVFGMMVGVSIAIAVGAYYRLSCFLFFLGHTYLFLVASEYYLNHAYLISLVAFLMIFVPAHRAASIDVLRDPSTHRTTVPFWPIVLLCGLQGIVFFFGALAKMNADWVFGFEPIRHWLEDRATSASAPVARILRDELTVRFVAWGGTAFDLLVVPALIWRRTRTAATVLSSCFHLSNAYLFNIGIFPWFMLGATTLFWDPSWARRAPQIGPYVDALVEYAPDGAPSQPPAVTPAEQRRVIAALGAFALVMILVPLRQYLYPGDVAWTEEGHMFSWRMKLRDKRGRMSLRITDPTTGKTWVVQPLNDLSDRQVVKIVGRPDLLIQYIRGLDERYRASLGHDVEIRADVFVSLNYRPEQRFIDPTVDLTEVDQSLLPYRWILPFEETPLPSPVDAVDSNLARTADRIAKLASYHARAGSLPKRAQE